LTDDKITFRMVFQKHICPAAMRAVLAKQKW